MNSYKFLVAGLLLCGSQLVFSATQAQQEALDAAISSLSRAATNNAVNQTMVDEVIQAAANADIPAAFISAQLYSLNVPVTMITTAMTTNIRLGTSGAQPACSPACPDNHTAKVSYTSASYDITTAALANVIAQGSAVAQSSSSQSVSSQSSNGQSSISSLASTGGSFTTGGSSGGPTGAVSPH